MKGVGSLSGRKLKINLSSSLLDHQLLTSDTFLNCWMFPPCRILQGAKWLAGFFPCSGWNGLNVFLCVGLSCSADAVNVYETLLFCKPPSFFKRQTNKKFVSAQEAKPKQKVSTPSLSHCSSGRVNTCVESIFICSRMLQIRFSLDWSIFIHERGCHSLSTATGFEQSSRKKNNVEWMIGPILACKRAIVTVSPMLQWQGALQGGGTAHSWRHMRHESLVRKDVKLTRTDGGAFCLLVQWQTWHQRS